VDHRRTFGRDQQLRDRVDKILEVGRRVERVGKAFNRSAGGQLLGQKTQERRRLVVEGADPDAGKRARSEQPAAPFRAQLRKTVNSARRGRSDLGVLAGGAREDVVSGNIENRCLGPRAHQVDQRCDVRLVGEFWRALACGDILIASGVNDRGRSEIRSDRPERDFIGQIATQVGPATSTEADDVEFRRQSIEQASADVTGRSGHEQRIVEFKFGCHSVSSASLTAAFRAPNEAIVWTSAIRPMPSHELCKRRAGRCQRGKLQNVAVSGGIS
jgi:hypothetical protein